jgi:predicted nucleic acid-binding protein
MRFGSRRTGKKAGVQSKGGSLGVCPYVCRLKKADTTRFAELLNGLPIVVEWTNSEHALTRVLANGRKFGLSSYDAAYLELAMRQGVPLASRDRALRAACRKGGIRLFEPASGSK